MNQPLHAGLVCVLFWGVNILCNNNNNNMPLDVENWVIVFTWNTKVVQWTGLWAGYGCFPDTKPFRWNLWTPSLSAMRQSNEHYKAPASIYKMVSLAALKITARFSRMADMHKQSGSLSIKTDFLTSPRRCWHSLTNVTLCLERLHLKHSSRLTSLIWAT